MISRVLALVLLSFSLALASFSTDLDTLAMKMADALKLSPQEPLSITTINLDKNYMLPLDPILLKLKEKLNSYSKSVAFNPSVVKKMLPFVPSFFPAVQNMSLYP